MNKIFSFAFGAALASSIGLVVGTQYVAFMTGYDIRLGLPWSSDMFISIYNPLSIVSWWFRWHRVSPVMNTGILVAGGVALVAGAVFAWGSLHSANFGAKEWGSLKDAMRAKIAHRRRSLNGIVLGLWLDGSRILWFFEGTHVIIFGASGSAKTRGPIISTLLAWRGSVLVIDPKTELYGYTANFRQSLGDALYFDPLDPLSMRWNPLDEIPVGTELEIGAVMGLADVIVESSGLGNDNQKFWPITAKDLLSGLISFVIHDMPAGRQNMKQVFDLLGDLAKTVNAMVKSSQEHVRHEAGKLFSLDPKTISNISATVGAALSLWVDPTICRTTAVSDMKLEQLVTGKFPVSLYFQVRASEAPRLAMLQQMMAVSVMRMMLYHPKRVLSGEIKRHKLLGILEEFPSMGKLRTFETDIKQARGFGYTMMICCQSLRDLEQVYGATTTILENTHIQVYFASADANSQKAISQALGEAVEVKESVSRPRGWTTQSSQGSSSSSEQRRALMDPGAIRAMDLDSELICVTGFKPFLAKKIRWDEHPVLEPRGTNIWFDHIPDPAQNVHVLNALRERPVVIEATAAQEPEPPAKTPIEIFGDVGLQPAALTKLLFPSVPYKTAYAWMRGKAKIPTDAIQFLKRVVEALRTTGDPARVLVPEVLERIRHGEIVS